MIFQVKDTSWQWNFQKIKRWSWKQKNHWVLYWKKSLKLHLEKKSLEIHYRRNLWISIFKIHVWRTLQFVLWDSFSSTANLMLNIATDNLARMKRGKRVCSKILCQLLQRCDIALTLGSAEKRLRLTQQNSENLININLCGIGEAAISWWRTFPKFLWLISRIYTYSTINQKLIPYILMLVADKKPH